MINRNFILKKIAWFIVGFIIVYQVNHTLGLGTIGGILVSIPLWVALFYIYNHYIQQRFK